VTRNTFTRRALTLAIAIGALAGAPTASADIQTMIVTSDPQYPWTERTDGGGPESEGDRERRSEALITEQYRSIVAYRAARPGQDIPVFVNGDLTAYGHGYQRDVMARLLGILGDNVHLGLGNHDYQNNIRQPDGAGCYNNGCARDSVGDLVTHVTNKPGKISFDFSVTPGVFTTVYEGSLAYATNTPGLDRVLSIQLNNYPAYEVTFESQEGIGTGRYEIGSSLPWLRHIVDHQLAKPAHGDWKDRDHDFAIVHMHMPRGFEGDFANIVGTTDIAAIFAGHLHTRLGRDGDIGGVPMYLSGSASQRTYLIVEHDTDEGVLRVYGVRNNEPEEKTLIDTVPVHRLH
jgi:hypothetical protein